MDGSSLEHVLACMTLELHLKLSWSSPVPTVQFVSPFFGLILPQTFTSELTGSIAIDWTVGRLSQVPLIWPLWWVVPMKNLLFPERKPRWITQVQKFQVGEIISSFQFLRCGFIQESFSIANTPFSMEGWLMLHRQYIKMATIDITTTLQAPKYKTTLPILTSWKTASLDNA